MTAPNWFGWTESEEEIQARTDRRNWEHAAKTFSLPPVTEEDADYFLQLIEAANTDPQHIRTADPRTPEQIALDEMYCEQQDTYNELRQLGHPF